MCGLSSGVIRTQQIATRPRQPHGTKDALTKQAFKLLNELETTNASLKPIFIQKARGATRSILGRTPAATALPIMLASQAKSTPELGGSMTVQTYRTAVSPDDRLRIRSRAHHSNDLDTVLHFLICVAKILVTNGSLSERRHESDRLWSMPTLCMVCSCHRDAFAVGYIRRLTPERFAYYSGSLVFPRAIFKIQQPIRLGVLGRQRIPFVF